MNLRNQKSLKSKSDLGFTLMEVTVATTIFVIVTVSLMSLFNYVLKINRRSEALRQASQGMRSFVEFLVKEIRNGQIDYYVANGDTYSSGIGPCVPPGTVGNSVTGANSYGLKENKLGIINVDGIQECFYLGNSAGTYVDTIGAAATTFTVSAANKGTLVMEKVGVSSSQVLNPPNFRIENLTFLIRPTCDPYTASCTSYSNGYPKMQPSVVIIIKFVAQLETGESVPIYYQTTVSSNKYDIPS